MGASMPTAYARTLRCSFKCNANLLHLPALVERDFAFAPSATWEIGARRNRRSAPGRNERETCTLIGDSTGSVARVPAAVLAEIGCRALRAVNGRRTIIIGEGAGLAPRPVIVAVADFVGQHIKPNVVAPRLDQARRHGQGGQNCGG